MLKLIFYLIIFSFMVAAVIGTISIVILGFKLVSSKFESSFNDISRYVENRIDKNKADSNKVKIKNKVSKAEMEKLKLQYSTLNKIINDQVEKIVSEDEKYVVDYNYLARMDEYFKDIQRISVCSIPIEEIACFFKAIMEVPILYKENSSKDEIISINRTLLENVLLKIKCKYKGDIYYISLYKDIYIEHYNKERNDIYLLCYYIISIID